MLRNTRGQLARLMLIGLVWAAASAAAAAPLTFVVDSSLSQMDSVLISGPGGFVNPAGPPGLTGNLSLSGTVTVDFALPTPQLLDLHLHMAGDATILLAGPTAPGGINGFGRVDFRNANLRTFGPADITPVGGGVFEVQDIPSTVTAFVDLYDAGGGLIGTNIPGGGASLTEFIQLTLDQNGDLALDIRGFTLGVLTELQGGTQAAVKADFTVMTQPIPEPSTELLMPLGLLLVGWSLRRKTFLREA